MSAIEVIEEDRPLPAPVEITVLPDESIPEAIAFWESLEGMLVSVENAVVVSPTTRFGEFAVLAEANAAPGSGYHPESGHLIIRPLPDGGVDYNPERIIVDDEILDAAIVLSPGDGVTRIRGVVHYSFGNYKIQPIEIAVERQGAEQPSRNSSEGLTDAAADQPRSEVTEVATFNMENLFDRVNEPGKDDSGSTPSARELETKLTKLTMTVTGPMGLPAIVAVQEVENEGVLAVLADRINGAAGTSYRGVSFESSDGRGIENGFLYDEARVDLVEARRLDGPLVSAAFGPRSRSPGREPMVAVFEIGAIGRRLTIVNNHFKSKGGDEPLFGLNWPPRRPTEEQRRDQAKAVRGFVDRLLESDPQALVMVVGDMNDFQFAEPGEATEPGDAAEHALSIIEGRPGPTALRNLVFDVPEAYRFTYVYDGNGQVLDHILASHSVVPFVESVEIIGGNADAPALLARDPSTPRRSSDHNPVIVRLARPRR